MNIKLQSSMFYRNLRVSRKWPKQSQQGPEKYPSCSISARARPMSYSLKPIQPTPVLRTSVFPAITFTFVNYKDIFLLSLILHGMKPTHFHKI